MERHLYKELHDFMIDLDLYQRESREDSGYFCDADADVCVDLNYYRAHPAAELVLFCILPFGLIIYNNVRVSRSLHLSVKDLTKLSSQ